MTPKQRVLTALNHQEADRVPLDIGGMVDSSIHYLAYNNLMRHIGKPELATEKEETFFLDIGQFVVHPHTEIVEQLGIDVRGFVPGAYKTRWHEAIQKEGRVYFFFDSFGGKWVNVPGSYYFDQEPGGYPLARITSSHDIKSVTWPVLGTADRVKGVREIIRELGERYAIVAGDPMGGIFAQGFRLRGYQNFYLDLAGNPSLACALMDKLLEIKLQYWDVVLDAMGDLVDVVVFEDDLGEQNQSMISPKMYRDLIKPRHAEAFEFIKHKTDHRVKVLLHSDGAIYDLIPDLIEAGIDALNPIQVSCAGMDSRRLKKEFGNDICFWGAAADSQNVLGSGTPGQVRDEVKRRLDDLAPGGGLICASVHNIQPDVPPENIMAMWETIKEYGRY